MKKADLLVGQEYAVYGRKIVPEGGVAAMDDRHGQGSFPLYGVGRARIEAIDVAVEVPSGYVGVRTTETKKMIRVTWLLNAKGQVEVPTDRGVYYLDKSLLTSAAIILCPWQEYIAERNKRAEAVEVTQRHNEQKQVSRARVLALLEARGVAAREGRGFSNIEIEWSEMERLLSMVAFEAADEAIQDTRREP